MQLQTWLSTNKVSLGQFAKRIGVANASVVRRYAMGRMPRPQVLQRIHSETDGQVTANDFVPANTNEKDGTAA